VKFLRLTKHYTMTYLLLN